MSELREVKGVTAHRVRRPLRAGGATQVGQRKSLRRGRIQLRLALNTALPLKRHRYHEDTARVELEAINNYFDSLSDTAQSAAFSVGWNRSLDLAFRVKLNLVYAPD